MLRIAVAVAVSDLAAPPLPGDQLMLALIDAWLWVSGRPWLAVVPAVLIVAGHAVQGWVWRWRQQRLATHAQVVTISPPPVVEPGSAAAWWANMAELLTPSRWRRLLYGTPHVAFEFRWTGRQLTIHVWVPGTVPAGPVGAAVRAAWPGASATIAAVGDIAPPLPTGPRVVDVGGALAPALPAWYPLATDHDTDPLRALLGAGAGLHASEHACVQVLARPATPRQLTRLRRGAASLKTGRPPRTGVADTLVRGGITLVEDLIRPPRSVHRRQSPTWNSSRPGVSWVDPLRERDAGPGLEKTTGPQWQTAIRYGVAAVRPAGQQPPRRREDAVTRRVTTVAHGLSSAFGSYAGRNRFRRLHLPAPGSSLADPVLRRGFGLSTGELAAIAALPLDLAVPGLDRAGAKAVPAPVAVPGGGRGTKPLGRALVGGHAVALPVADARHHLHLLGSTGSGKSTLMLRMILADVAAHRGVVLIDPKGDLAADVLARLPLSVVSRLVLIDPDQRGGAYFNPLQVIPGQLSPGQGADEDLVVDNIVSIFAKTFARHWGPRIDDVLRVACLTLMRYPKARLSLVPPLLNDKQFRAPYTVALNDPAGLRGFWEWYEATPPGLRAQVTGAVLARLRSFLLRDFVRRTIGTETSSFDMSTVLDGGILIARLPKGQLGEETAKLLGSFVFARVWQAATARARIPEARRRDAAVYVDEAHNILNLAGSVSDQLAEARGYGLSLTLAHQNLAQLPRETQLALSANARNKIFFTCAPEDAHQLARHTLPHLDEQDLTHLDAYTAAARLVIGNRETTAFTLHTQPAGPPLDHTNQIRRAVALTTPAPPETDDTNGNGNGDGDGDGNGAAGAEQPVTGPSTSP
jgi:hypothetical protein